jgi:hypothetical protein
MAKNTTKASDKNVVRLVEVPGEAPSRTIARRVLDPTTSAAATLNGIHRTTAPDGDINGYIAELQQQAQAATAGKLDRPEAMLTTQAGTLDALFHKLTEWAVMNASKGNAAYFETCMRLALKAQSQSRATNETLAEIKNPPNVAFVRQANIAAGSQQVNNGVRPSRAGENEIPRSKLLEAEHGERLDARTTIPASAANQAMETVDAIDRTADHGG